MGLPLARSVGRLGPSRYLTDPPSPKIGVYGNNFPQNQVASPSAKRCGGCVCVCVGWGWATSNSPKSNRKHCIALVGDITSLKGRIQVDCWASSFRNVFTTIMSGLVVEFSFTSTHNQLRYKWRRKTSQRLGTKSRGAPLVFHFG